MGSLCLTTDECNSTVIADAMAHVTRIYVAGLLILGLFGNAYCVSAFLMPDYRRVPSSLYLSALALSDIGFLITLGLMWMQSIGLRFLDVSRMCTACMFLSYFCCFVSGWLVLAVTAERYLLSKGMGGGDPNALDRRQPPREGTSRGAGGVSRRWWHWLWTWAKSSARRTSSRINHHCRIRLTFVSIIACGALFNMWVLFAADSYPASIIVDENYTEVTPEPSAPKSSMICDVSHDVGGNLYPIFNALDMIFSFTLPFLGTLFLNAKIGFRVCKARDLARRSAGGSSNGVRRTPSSHANGFYYGSNGGGGNGSVSDPPRQHEQRSQVVETQLVDENGSTNRTVVSARASVGIARGGRRRHFSRSRAVETKVTKLLVTVSMAYLILNLPSYVHRVVFAFQHPTTASTESSTEAYPVKSPTEIIAETLSYLMFYTQFSINFFLYSCHGCMFGFVC